MLQRDQIIRFKDLISICIEKQSKGQASPVTQDDVEMIKSFVIMMLEEKDQTPLSLAALSAYFVAVKVPLKEAGDETNQELRQLLFQQLLERQVNKASEQKHYNVMWQIFTECLEGKLDYRDQCITEL